MDVFGHIVGHQRTRRTLCAAVESGRAHHAWIFHGPAGVGKRAVAEAFAAGLLDGTARIEKHSIVVDDQSPTQRLLRGQAGHPDMHVVTKELARFAKDKQVRDRKLLSIPKEVVQERLLAPVHLAAKAPAGGVASKVFLVDEAELLGLPVQNALLKTLEEPPLGVVIVLLTASQERLLPTVRSRCQRAAFAPLADDEIVAWARRKGVGPEGGLEAGAWEVRRAAGSPGRLRSLLQEGVAAWEAELAPMLLATLRGRYVHELGPAMAGLVDGWAAAHVKANNGASKDAANKRAAEMLLTMLLDAARDRLREAVDEHRDAGPAIAGIETIERAWMRIGSNVNMQLAMETLAVNLAQAADATVRDAADAWARAGR